MYFQYYCYFNGEASNLLRKPLLLSTSFAIFPLPQVVERHVAVFNYAQRQLFLITQRYIRGCIQFRRHIRIRMDGKESKEQIRV
jgi:hypothetical protein